MAEWLLAFDAGCKSCSDVIGRIRAQVGDRLAVAALGEPRIRELRCRALGERPPFAPTLIVVDGDRVRAWTGPRLSARLAWLLGPARSIAVMRALNRADVVVNGDRRGLLKAVPLVALGAFVVSGGLVAPAMAAPGRRRMTVAEVDEVVDRLQPLPSTYPEFAAQPMVIRHAIYGRLSQSQRAGLWQEHLSRYRSAHPNLTGAQSAALEQVLALIPAVFGSADGTVSSRLDRAKSAAIAAFGRREAAAVFATLGPAEEPGAITTSTTHAASSSPTQLPRSCECFCECNPDFTPCDSCGQEAFLCYRTYKGCGILNQEDCTGLCGGG
jgi:uncharacterized membrane protein